MGTRIIKYLRFFKRCILSVIYDDGSGCVICGNEYEENSEMCSKCRSHIKECDINSIVEKNNIAVQFFSSSYYSSIIKELIIRLKYKGDFRAGEALAELMLEVIKKNSLKFDVIAFVPSSKKALRKRGYNQSRFLAKIIGQRTEKKVIDCLRKVIETRDQIGLDSSSRWMNLEKCFKAVNIKSVKNNTILLVDDVITTGATAFYCARELMNNGSGKVIVLTAAKSKI